MNKDRSHSWIGISHDLNWLVKKLEQHGTTTNKKPLGCNSKIVHWKRRYFVLRTEQKFFKKNIKTYFCKFIHKNYTYWWKILDRYSTTRLLLFVHRLSSVEASEKTSWPKEWETIKDLCIALILREKILNLQAFLIYSRCNLVDPTLQDTVVFPSNFLPAHFSHRMCNHLHSIMNSR